MRESTKPSCSGCRRKALLIATASVSLLLASPTFAQDQTQPAVEMTDSEWQILGTKIGDRVNEIANSRRFFERDRRPIVVVAAIDRTSNTLYLDLDVSFGEDVGDLQLEDFQDAIDAGIEDLTALIPGFNSSTWRIGGHGMDYWFNQSIADSDVPDLQGECCRCTRRAA